MKFEGNNSKRWDGKEIELKGEWLESLYSQEELTPGNRLDLPWPGKGKSVTHWKVIVVDSASKKNKVTKEEEPLAGLPKKS